MAANNELFGFGLKVVELQQVWTKAFQQNLQLSKGKFGTWRVQDDPNFPSCEEIMKHWDESHEKEQPEEFVEARTYKVSQIDPDTTVSVKVRVFDRRNIKYLRYKSGTRMRVRVFLVGDHTGIIPYTAFND